MTSACTARPHGVATIDSAIAALRAGGLRVSAARRLVLEALFAAEGPATVEELAAGFDGRVPRSDVASTYRNLETLEALGLVRHMHLGHGPGRYVLALVRTPSAATFQPWIALKWYRGFVPRAAIKLERVGCIQPLSSYALLWISRGCPCQLNGSRKRVRHLLRTGSWSVALCHVAPPSTETSTRVTWPRPDQAIPEIA